MTIGVQFAPRAGPNVAFGVHPRDAERFVVRSFWPPPSALLALALLFLATLGQLEAVRGRHTVGFLAASAFALAAVAGVLLRKRVTFDRRHGTLEEAFLLLGPFARRTQPLRKVRRVIVAPRDYGRETRYPVWLDLGGEMLELDWLGLWEAAAPLAEAVARFLDVPLADEYRAGERAAAELDRPLRDQEIVGAAPARPAGGRCRVEVDRPVLLRVAVPRPALRQSLFLVGLVLAFCMIPLTVEHLGPVLQGWRPSWRAHARASSFLLPVLIVGAGVLRHVVRNGGTLSVTPDRARFLRHGVFWRTAIEVPAAEVEDVAIVQPEMGGARALLAYFSNGALVVRSDREAFRLGHDLSPEELAWLRHRVLEVLRRGAGGAAASGAPAAAAAAPMFPLWARVWLGAGLGALVGRMVGGVLGVCVALPFVEQVLNVGALVGAHVGAALEPSIWHAPTARRTAAGALGGLTLALLLATGWDGLQAAPSFDERTAWASPTGLHPGWQLAVGALDAIVLGALLLAAFQLRGGG